MKTSLREIIALQPCWPGITKLLNGLGYKCAEYPSNGSDSLDWWKIVYNSLTDNQKDKPIDFVFLLSVLEFEDTFWCLQTQPKMTRIRISAAAIKLTLNIVDLLDGNVVYQMYITQIKKYCNGKFTSKKLIDTIKTLFLGSANINQTTNIVITALNHVCHGDVRDVLEDIPIIIKDAIAGGFVYKSILGIGIKDQNNYNIEQILRRYL